MLQNLMRKMKKGNKGFTLVELMIVVVIIGILIAIAIPIYNSIQTNAEKRACQANLRSIKAQLEIYKADESTGGGNGSYPETANWGTFLNYAFEGVAPVCPTADAGYVYAYAAASGGTYSLICPAQNAGTVTDHTL